MLNFRWLNTIVLYFMLWKRETSTEYNSFFFCTSYEQLFLFPILENCYRFSARSLGTASKGFRGFSQPLLKKLNNATEYGTGNRYMTKILTVLRPSLLDILWNNTLKDVYYFSRFLMYHSKLFPSWVQKIWTSKNCLVTFTALLKTAKFVCIIEFTSTE
jgi:hypothetical protein